MTCHVYVSKGGADELTRVRMDTRSEKLEPLAICLSGSIRQPMDRTRYHRAPGPLRLDHSCCAFHDGKAYISYGVNVLGDIDVIEKTYGLDPDEVARENGFQRDPHTYGSNQPRSKWWTGYNQFQVVPIEWFYDGA